MSFWPSPTCPIPIPYHCLPTPLPSYIRVPASLHPSSPHTITTPHHNRHMALPPHTITILHHRCLHPHHPICPSSPHTVAPRHPCYQPSLSCTTDLSVVVQRPQRTVALPPCAVTLQPPAQPCASSTQLPHTLHHPVPSVPWRHRPAPSLPPSSCHLAPSSYPSSSFSPCTFTTPHQPPHTFHAL